jgi:asparagine synthase (glutamine-hydrolysing)
LRLEEIAEPLPEIIFYLESFDVDLVRSAIPCYFASRLASDYFKVVLTAEGSDELFARYDYHRHLADTAKLQEDLDKSLAALHSMNLQRLDRMTMAHSIEGRVPFLDSGVIEVAQSIPATLKLCGRPPVEKWILRRACDDLLPFEILWRRKAQFDEGSGTTGVLAKVIEQVATRHGVPTRGATTDRQLEARLYHHLYRMEFPSETDRLVAHWRGSTETLRCDDLPEEGIQSVW